MRFRLALAALAPVALGLVVAGAAAIWDGGCSTCGACPEGIVHVTASANVQLDIKNLAWGGPACPGYRPMCRGDDITTSCTHVDITGAAPGECDLAILFGSGLIQVVHAQFGPAPKACCGVEVIGETTFVIPVDQDAGVVGSDGPTDAVTTVVDAGDAGGSTDAATDAPADGGTASD
jgi:hypothetical protein